MELLLDADSEDGVRDLWDRLREAGLPGLADHPHPTNRPHLTLLTATSLDGPAPLSLPIRAKLGAVRLLGRALVRVVTPTVELRELQARVWSSVAGADPWPAPADWVPHVSLALRIPADRQETALRLLATVPPAEGHFVAARSYDTQSRKVTTW
ncbi:2'-5' RNA ligase family protein [Micromonosporaceae bacterium Da 78-11]